MGYVGTQKFEYGIYYQAWSEDVEENIDDD